MAKCQYWTVTKPSPSRKRAATAQGAGNERTYRGLSTEQRTLERRQLLIDAAIALYGRDGYRATSVKAVCRRAGLTERYFYESFANSDALLCACCKHLMDAMRRAALQATVGGRASLSLRVEAMALSYAAQLRRNPAAARLTLFEMEGVSPEVDRFLHLQLAKTASLIEEVAFADLPERPEQDLKTSLLAIGLMGALYQLAKEWTRTNFQWADQELAHHIAALGVGAVLSWKRNGTARMTRSGVAISKAK